MSASQSENAAKSVANQEGEVGSHIKPQGPQTTHGHQPGQMFSENDKIPESHAQPIPAGTAPASRTFAPQTQGDIPGQASNPSVSSETTVGATDMPGATSGDVHTGLGHPGAGMSSSEMRHDGQPHRAGQGGGLQGVGAKGAVSESQLASERKDMSTSVPGSTQKVGGEAPGASLGEDRNM